MSLYSYLVFNLNLGRTECISLNIQLEIEGVGDNHLSRYNMVKIKVKNFTPKRKRNQRSNVNKKGLKK